MLLSLSAFLVINLWLDAAWKGAQGARRPDLFNSDDNPLEFTILHLSLRPSVTAPKLRAPLATIPALRAENAKSVKPRSRFSSWLRLSLSSR